MKIVPPARICVELLLKNGWKYDPYGGNGPYGCGIGGVYIKHSSVAVQFEEDEIVILDDTGDIAHLPINYYALLGWLIDMRQISISYKSIRGGWND